MSEQVNLQIEPDSRVTAYIGYCPYCPIHEGVRTHERLTELTRVMRQCPRCKRVFVVADSYETAALEQSREYWKRNAEEANQRVSALILQWSAKNEGLAALVAQWRKEAKQERAGYFELSEMGICKRYDLADVEGAYERCADALAAWLKAQGEGKDGTTREET